MTISHDGLFSVGRDQDGSLTVNGNLVLDSGGELMVGRNLDDLTVNGNVIVNPSGSGIVVNGVLGGLVARVYSRDREARLRRRSLTWVSGSVSMA